MLNNVLKRIAPVLFVFIFVPASGWAQTPACSGRDMLEEMRNVQPEQYRRVETASGLTPNARAVFWRIESGAGPPSYLFGTVHLTDDRVNALPPAVSTALAEARHLVLEVAGLSPSSLGSAVGRVQDLLAFSNGQSLGTLLSDDEFKLAERATGKAGIPPAALTTLRPWVITMTLALSDCERQRTATGLLPLDSRLEQTARKRGIPVSGLETIEDQLRAMARVPEDDQITILKATLRLYHRTDDMIETTIRRYLARDLGSVWPLQEELWRAHGFPPAAFASFQRELVTVRNVRMRDAALPILRDGGAFIAVGALHLPGQEGLVEMFRRAGFAVTPAE